MECSIGRLRGSIADHPAGQRARQSRSSAAADLRSFLRALSDRHALGRVLRRCGDRDRVAALLGSLATSLALPFIFVPPESLSDLAVFFSLGLIGGAGHYLGNLLDALTRAGALIIILSGLYIALRERRLRTVVEPG